MIEFTDERKNSIHIKSLPNGKDIQILTIRNKPFYEDGDKIFNAIIDDEMMLDAIVYSLIKYGYATINFHGVYPTRYKEHLPDVELNDLGEINVAINEQDLLIDYHEVLSSRTIDYIRHKFSKYGYTLSPQKMTTRSSWATFILKPMDTNIPGLPISDEYNNKIDKFIKYASKRIQD